MLRPFQPITLHFFTSRATPWGKRKRSGKYITRKHFKTFHVEFTRALARSNMKLKSSPRWWRALLLYVMIYGRKFSTSRRKESETVSELFKKKRPLSGGSAEGSRLSKSDKPHIRTFCLKLLLCPNEIYRSQLHRYQPQAFRTIIVMFCVMSALQLGRITIVGGKKKKQTK